MPELPDVEIFRRYSRKVLNKKIKKISINVSSLLDVSKSTLHRHLGGNKFVGTDRIGKYLLLEISDGYFLVLHFGMTGDISYYQKKKPEYIVLKLLLSNNRILAVTSKRKLGSISIVKSKKELKKDKNLGPDFLSLSKQDFVEIMEKSRGYVKTKLMDQSKISGIGNIYSDEALYSTGLYPKKKIETISQENIRKLYSNLLRVIRVAIRNGADPKKMPSSYLLNHRKPGEKCGKCGGEITKIKVGGRSSYFCKKHQKR